MAGSDPRRVDSIVVVGGGDVGLLTALALEKGLDDPEIVVVDDFEESVLEVGKSTLSYVVTFLLDSLEIDLTRLISEAKLAWKTTVYFEDWPGVEPFHSPLGQPLPITSETRGSDRTHDLTPDHEVEFEEFLHRYRERDFSTIYGELAETPGKAPLVVDTANANTVRKPLPSVSYHFNSRSFNRFLRRLCRERGVDLVDDRVVEVAASGDRIDRVASETTAYEADLYVDASGFERALVGELDNPLVEFDLPVDSAVVSTVDIPLSEIVSATVVTSGEAGWFWQIDTAATRPAPATWATSTPRRISGTRPPNGSSSRPDRRRSIRRRSAGTGSTRGSSRPRGSVTASRRGTLWASSSRSSRRR